MTKRQTAVYAVLGLVVGLALTACAGAAAGKLDLPGVGEVIGVGPGVDTLTLEELPAFQLPAFNPVQTSSMELLRTVEAQDQVESRLRLEQFEQAKRQIQERIQTQTHDQRFCMGGN